MSKISQQIDLDPLSVDPMKVVVVGASPDVLNTNSVLRGYVVEGFRAIVGEARVQSSSMEGAYKIIREFEPDLVLVFGSCLPDSAYYISIRDYCDRRSVPLCFWLHDDPYEFDFHRKIVPYADFVFSNDRFATLHYPRNLATHVPLAASQEAHFVEVMDESKMEYDIFFCGVAFNNRKQVVRDLDGILRKYRTYIIGPGWDAMGLPYCFGGSLSNSEFAKTANKSKFVLNIGRQGDLANDLYQLPPSTPGPRTFEAAMAGSLQLYFTEGLEILDYFKAGEEILLVDSKKNFESILADQDPIKNRVLRVSAQIRALKDHTYVNRAKAILERVRTQ